MIFLTTSSRLTKEHLQDNRFAGTTRSLKGSAGFWASKNHPAWIQQISRIEQKPCKTDAALGRLSGMLLGLMNRTCWSFWIGIIVSMTKGLNCTFWWNRSEHSEQQKKDPELHSKPPDWWIFAALASLVSPAWYQPKHSSKLGCVQTTNELEHSEYPLRVGGPSDRWMPHGKGRNLL